MCGCQNENITQAVQKKRRIIDTAMRREPADLVLKNASYVNVFTNEISTGDIAAGASSDHECRNIQDAIAKLERGRIL